MFESWQLIVAGTGLTGAVFTVLGVWVVAHEVQIWRWRRSLTAFHVRLPRTVSTAEVARWVSATRSIMRAHRWWSLLVLCGNLIWSK